VIPVLVSVLMWLLVASLLILRWGRADRSITYSAVTIAVSMTLNIDPVYVAVDDAFGGANIATLVADLALMVGIFFLGRGVARASEYQPRAVRIALGRTVLAVALVGVVFAFSLIDRGGTTTSFMLDLGAQPAAAAYSIIQFGYDGVVVAVMAVVAARQIAQSRGMQRLPSTLLLVGSLSGVALAATVLVMDVAHVAGNVGLMSTVSTIYGPLFLSTFLFLCLGLAGQPGVRWALARSRERRTHELVRQLTPTWRRAAQIRPGISQGDLAGLPLEDSEAQLHRQVVEIRDAAIDPRVCFKLNKQERVMVDDAEAHLLGQDPTEGRKPVPLAGESREAR
jgi:hypothetical protein